MKVDGILVYEDIKDNDWIITRDQNKNKPTNERGEAEWIWHATLYSEEDPEKIVNHFNSKTLPGLLRFVDRMEKERGPNSSTV